MPLVIEHQSTSGSIIRTTPKTNPNPPPASIPLLVTLMTLRTSINYSQTHLMAANKRQTLATSSNQRAHHHHHSHYNNHLGPSRFLLAPVGGPKGRSDTWETSRPFQKCNYMPLRPHISWWPLGSANIRLTSPICHYCTFFVNITKGVNPTS